MIEIILFGRHDERIETLLDTYGFILDAIAAWKGPERAPVRRIDPYASVDFAASEMPPLIAELDAILASVEKRELQKIVRAVARLARRCDAEGDRLRFAGD